MSLSAPSVEVDGVPRLPFGFLEKYALSTDRRKLLNLENKDQKTKEGGKISVSINECGDIIHGSIDYIYYYLLQCENEINQIFKNPNFQNKQSKQYKQLKQQFNDLSFEMTQCFAKYNDQKYPRFFSFFSIIYFFF